MSTELDHTVIRCPRCGTYRNLKPAFEGPELVSFTCPCGHSFTPAEGAGPKATKQKGKAVEKSKRDEQLLKNAVASDGEKVPRVLPVDLTLDEQRERGLQLATALADGRKLTEDKKTVMADFKARENAQAITVSQLEQVVSTRREFREVDCTEWRDYKAGKVHTVRDDLGSIVDTRQMTPTERQQLLPDPVLQFDEVIDADKKSSGKKTDGKQKPKGRARAATPANA